MKPAFSVIIFTCLSGAGYGLLLFLSVGVMGKVPTLYSGLGYAASETIIYGIGWAVGFVLVGISLLASLFHLGHPERFLRALTQWRTSWLSREGVLAIVSFVPLGLMAFVQLYFGLYVPILVMICIFVVFLTVYSTSMIYGSIKAIPMWFNKLTPAVYISFGASSGWMLLLVFKAAMARQVPGDFTLAAILIVLAYAILIGWWITNDRAGPIATIGAATGLGAMGEVTQLDRPHMNENYLLEEMGFVIGRKHSDVLRRIAVIVGGIVPLAVMGVAFLVGSSGVMLTIIFGAAALCHLVGIFISRWLFFAQAKHTVMLYYGQDQV